MLQVVLREPFASCTLFEVALFLRCAYRPADLTSANLDAVRGSLLGLLRLADQLDAPGVMHALAVYMRGELCACKSGSGVEVGAGGSKPALGLGQCSMGLALAASPCYNRYR